MVIRPGGYNTGAQEYLETGNKAGRELHRDELDHRMIIDGDLDLTRSIYESIPDHGQDRYLTFTMSFREDQLGDQMLRDITQEFKQFLMHAYKLEEFNFYAEAHLPKIKFMPDKKTGEMIERKPHIHIIVPRINLLSGNEANPVDVYMNHVKFYEAFQEYINQKYELASPRDHVRIDIADAASVLSRYKADDFYGKNREFKQGLVKQVIERGVTDRKGFYALVGESGETRIRNEGKENEYIAVKLKGDAKFTNLKDTIFKDDFILRRELKMPPLDEKVIYERLQAWPQRAKEIKYVNKATPKFRQAYSEASPEVRVQMLADRESKFYQTYGDNNDRLHPGQRPRDHQRSIDEAQGRSAAGAADGLQDLSLSDVADHGQAGPARLGDGAVLLPSDAHVHLGQHQPGGDPGLRSPVPGGREGRGGTGKSGRRQPTAAVSATAAGTAKAGTTKPGRVSRTGAGPRARITDNPLPPHARNPRRMGSIEDIQARGRRLFDPLKPSVAPGPAFQLDRDKLFTPEPRGPSDPGKASETKRKSRPRTKRSAGTYNPSKAASAQKRFTDSSLPLFARNPNRVPTIADIQRHGARLFEPSKRRAAPLEIKLPSIKTLTANRSASTVAAYFRRQADQQQLAPAQRHALRRLNQQYFELRRSVFADQRLTRQDKSQLVSVLAFERLKATEQIHHQPSNKEVQLMGSAEIRKLIEDDKEEPGFSISGPRGATPNGVRNRVRHILDRLNKQLDPSVSQERARELAAKDIYTRKAKFSQNVHYLDKQTDKTLFVDTGTAIAMRRNGISESGVAVALQLAKERFGSTLTINGSADFKKLVIEAAAKNGLGVHFTDKAMNESLAARIAELEIERDDQGIARPEPVASPAPQQEAPTPPNFVHNGQPATLDLRQYTAQPDTSTVVADLASSASELVQREAAWRQSLGTVPLSEADVRGSDTVMGLRGEDHAVWLIATNDKTPDAVAMISSYMENDSYREAFKGVIEDFYTKSQASPETIKALDETTDFVVSLVNAIESRKATASLSADGNTVLEKPKDDRKIIHGELVNHGAAPYQNIPGKEQSYFVTLKTDTGKDRTLWGAGLADAMVQSQLKQGDRVRIEDKGTVPVTLQIKQDDGSTADKPGYRREWTVEPETALMDGPTAGDAQTPGKAAPSTLNFVYMEQAASLGLVNKADPGSATIQNPFESGQVIGLDDLMIRIDQEMEALEWVDDGPGQTALLNDLISRMTDPFEKQLLTHSMTERYVGEQEPSPSPAIQNPFEDGQVISLDDLMIRIDRELKVIDLEDYGPGQVALLNDLLSRMTDPTEKQLLDDTMSERYVGEQGPAPSLTIHEDGPEMD